MRMIEKEQADGNASLRRLVLPLPSLSWFYMPAKARSPAILAEYLYDHAGLLLSKQPRGYYRKSCVCMVKGQPFRQLTDATPPRL